MGKKAQGESEAQWLKVRVCWVDIEECESVRVDIEEGKWLERESPLGSRGSRGVTWLRTSARCPACLPLIMMHTKIISRPSSTNIFHQIMFRRQIPYFTK